MAKVKVSDFVVDFLSSNGIEDIFMVSGGTAMHLLDSLAVKKAVKHWCCHHEQAAVMAAEAYSRTREKMGAVLVTSGPGGTNAITGVAGCFMDSVPVIVLSGQVSVSQMIGNSKVRQLGTQEIDIISIAKPITKYAETVIEPSGIRHALEKAFYLAKSGRPGPVWVDIPLDVQSSFVEESSMRAFVPSELKQPRLDQGSALRQKASKVASLLLAAKRPLLYPGQGVRLAGAVSNFLAFAEKHQIPIVTARNANDIVPSDHPLFAGRPGTYGTRPGNFAVQNADLVIAIGNRLSFSQVGYDYKGWAKSAKKVVVDIDPAELDKPTVLADLKINCSASDFIAELDSQLAGGKIRADGWIAVCQRWIREYPVCLPEYSKQEKPVNSYVFVDTLSGLLEENDVVVTDMGLSFQGTHQAFKVKKGQRLFTSSGLAPMGFGLPAAIGACVAKSGSRAICICGDGGLQMNVQELQTVAHHKLPVKIFVINNQGYLSIRQTQRQYFNGRFIGAGPGDGLSCPDFVKVARAYGISAERIDSQAGMKEKLSGILASSQPVLCDIVIDPDQPQIPRSSSLLKEDGTFESRPLEDMYPFLDRDRFNKEMISR